MQTVVLSSPYRRRQAQDLCLQAPEGSICKISAPRRSNAQNDLMWQHIGTISRAKPEGRDYPPEIWKSLLMAEAGFKPRFEPSLDGSGVVPVGYKSSRLRKAEFSELLAAIDAYAAEHGIVLQKEG